MFKIKLKKVKLIDKKYFAKWWRDKELLKLTSGVLKCISDKEVDEYFQNIFKNEKDYHFMVVLGDKIIGHISLSKRKNNWYEIQIVIGEKEYWRKGYGSEAIRLTIQKAKKLEISKIYLEVRINNERAICAYEKNGFEKEEIISYPENKNLKKTLRMELKSL